MIDQSSPDQTSDICLLLRAHGEQHWLIYELVPVVRELEQRHALAEEDLGAAPAYLEALWIEAGMRAFETDAASAALEPARSCSDLVLHDKAQRYHAAVLRLRRALTRRVEPLLAVGSETTALLVDL
jgi:hypothetical protein